MFPYCEQIYTLADGTSLYCKIYGSSYQDKIDPDKTTIIVLHGGPGLDHTLLETYWPRLAANHQILLFDQRGCGRSSESSSEYWNLKQWASDLNELIQSIAFNKPPAVAGSSFGGHVALRFAIDYPTASSSLILCDTEGYMNLQEFLDRLHEKAVTKQLNADEIVNAAKEWFLSPSPIALQNYLRLVFPFYVNEPSLALDTSRTIIKPAVLQYYNENEFFSLNLLAELKKIQVHTLYLVNGISPFHSQESAEKTAKYLPKDLVKMVIYSDAGTEVYHHKPDECQSEINQFLEMVYTPHR